MTKENGKEFYHLIHQLNTDLMSFELEHMHEGVIGDLTLHEIHTIENIGHMEEHSMSEIAGKAGVRQSTMTVMINKLISKGFVERYSNSSDRRVVKVRLTEAGEKVHLLHDNLHQKVTAKWLETLKTEEQVCLIRALRKLNRKT